MSWSPHTDPSDDLVSTFEMYEQQDDYGLNMRSIRPGKTRFDVAEHDDVDDDDDDGNDDIGPDAKAELALDWYRRKLGFPKKTESQWPDEATEHDSSVDLEICKIIRNTGSDREPAKNPLNSKTTSRTAIPLDKYPVAGIKDKYLTPDHFKFDNVFVYSEPKKEDKPVKPHGGNEAPSSNTKKECMAHRKTFEAPTLGVAGEKYVSPAQLYASKARRNR